MSKAGGMTGGSKGGWQQQVHGVPVISLNCFTHLCMVLKDSMTFFSSCSESMADRGSFIQLSDQRSQSEAVVQRSR